MTVPIISTKLHIPPPPQTLVGRAHLTDRLAAGFRGKFILVSAPAGFGKTALLAEWAHNCSETCHVCWVHLDESDNESVRFVSYLIAALQTHHKDLGEAALSGLQSMPPAPIEAVLTSLVNELDASAGDLILVLDDYHLIDMPTIHGAVEFLIEHLPVHMGLVIATRTDPPLPIAANVYNGLAQLHLARNDLENARQCATTGLELAQQWGNMDSLAGSYLALAHIEHLEGNPADAQLALDEVKRIAATHSLSPDFEVRLAAFEAQSLHGGEELDGQAALIEPLSEREIEVLRLIAQGRSNAEIAAELIIALGTVKAHSSSIYRKLNVRGRTEAVIKAHKLSLL